MKEIWDKAKYYLYVFLIGITLGMTARYLLSEKPTVLGYEKRAEKLKYKYKNTLKAMAIQDSLLRISEEERDVDIESRDSLVTTTEKRIEYIDSLTHVNVDSNDLNEAMIWLDSQ